MADIVEYSGKYYIRLGDIVPTWQNGFSCEEAAQKYIDTHDILSATEEHIKYSDEDFQYVVDTYGFRPKGDLWIARKDNKVISLKPYEDTFTLNIQDKLQSSAYDVESIDELTSELDKIFESQVYATKSVQAKFFITAATAKEVARNMVRVKSSNIWSYTMNVKSKDDNTGDVYVQYKNKNGGPGDVYVYYNVPIQLWRRWLSAASKGNFMWRFIRNNFLYSKLTGDKKTKLKNGVSYQQYLQLQRKAEEEQKVQEKEQAQQSEYDRAQSRAQRRADRKAKRR